MFTIGKKALLALLLVSVAGALSACLNINTPPNNSDVTIGGNHGVAVEHPSGDANAR